ncbi:DNA methyltransferase [Frigoribacterium sp. PhB118]|uniref:class I SAM-dependent DNA methyltransferase n=1 Tax=Frigoribacterium sp. PhB118 TaxID=2485175 RepID=UPI000FB9C2B4|nr:DNA methyltransferase [Frigoribacterium sp. PhB118]ROS52455.1 type II restriction/modification system DNA methylase subunit YeeA [Frigoribacterium sp. PhB118]
MNSSHFLDLVDTLEFRKLFIDELGWNNPDQPPATFTVDNQPHTLTQVAGFKGLRIWYCPELPPRKTQRILDDLIGQQSHERLVIFADSERQEWRWPRRAQLGAANAKLLVHQHTNGARDAHMVNQLEAIAIDFDEDISLVELLTKMRLAFDAEANEASVQAARLMGTLYSELDAGGVDERDATLLLARILFLLFGDDSGMWSTGMFHTFMTEQTTDNALNEQLAELFRVLDTKEEKRSLPDDSPLSPFRYINGGLFADKLKIAGLTGAFRAALIAACEFDWGIISPAVFGSMFQTVKSKNARRHGGEHYTSETNILKTIRPLFLDHYSHRLQEGWDDPKALNKLHSDLGELRLLDPACGCGNFLIVAYRELRALELDLLKRKRELDIRDGRATVASRGQLSFDVTGDIKVTLDHFYGIEIEEWPARIAETAMLLVDHLANQRMEQDFGDAPDRLPIAIYPTIVHRNALEIQWEDILPATDSTYVFGNPPFVGQKEKEDTQTADMKRVWGKDYDGYLDYVTAWHKKTIDFLAPTTKTGFAFVTTNSVTQGQPVPPLFRAIFSAGWKISFAHRTFAWQSEAPGAAAVHCVIVGFSRDPRTVRLFDYDRPRSKPREIEVRHLNPYLIDGPDVFVDKRMRPLSPSLPPVLRGSQATDWGHLTIGPSEFEEISADLVMSKYLRRFVGGEELINSLDRWCLWLVDMDPADPGRSPELQARLDSVRTKRLASHDAPTRGFASTPHLFNYRRQPATDYLAIPNTFSEARRYMTVGRLPADTIAAIKLFTVEDPDGLLFAIFSSSMMLTWQKLVGGRMKSDPSFANTLVWNTFPMPSIGPDLHDALTRAGQDVLAVRNTLAPKSLAEMYDPLAMSAALIQAHDRLDDVVDAAFGFSTPPSSTQRQQRLFDHYVAMIDAGKLAMPSKRARSTRTL